MATPTTIFKALPEPERLGRYTLFHEIARGGMGIVYLARSRSSRRGYRRLVALKRMHPHLAGDQRLRRMFLDEARIVSQLAHPNIASAIDFGEEDGRVWLAMPFVLGESLDRVIPALQRAPPTVRDRLPELVTRILMDACEGLHAAHELRGADDRPLEVVHRDVTPRNVIVGYDGVTRVVDFGIASALHRLHQTATGELKGTPAYAAPEHVQGRPLDRRADVWSLGVLCWEMCTGRRLFFGEQHLEVLDKVLHAPIVGPAELVPELPLGLDEIALRALNRDPNRRYRSARAMGRDLASFASELGKPVCAADVAECMEALFPGELAARRLLLGEVRDRELDSATREPAKTKRQRPIGWLLAGAAAGALGTYTLLHFL